MMNTQWRATGMNIAAGHNYNLATYYAEVEGKRLKTRFRTLDNALKAAVKAMKQR